MLERFDLLVEHGHLLLQHRDPQRAIARYQEAHNLLPRGHPHRNLTTQGAAMSMATASGCHTPTAGGGAVSGLHGI